MKQRKRRNFSIFETEKGTGMKIRCNPGKNSIKESKAVREALQENRMVNIIKNSFYGMVHHISRLVRVEKRFGIQKCYVSCAVTSRSMSLEMQGRLGVG